MSETFGAEYAGAYDSLYRDKDYDAECALIRSLFALYARRPVHRVLDLGCGSGNHLLPLARAGCEMTGVDRSEAMLSEARRKLESEGVSATVACADIRTWRSAQAFDAALMMFAVLGYQLEDEDVSAALAAARRSLHSGGLLIFDVWYGPAVLSRNPETRKKVVETPDGALTRVASGTLDIQRHLCHVRFRVDRGDAARGPREFEEHHTVRYFFPLELKLFLDGAGFELVRLGAFPEFDREPDLDTWNVLAVARAC